MTTVPKINCSEESASYAQKIHKRAKIINSVGAVSSMCSIFGLCATAAIFDKAARKGYEPTHLIDTSCINKSHKVARIITIAGFIGMLGCIAYQKFIDKKTPV